MTIVDQLTTNLLDLLFELEGQKIPIMIGGGYGLFLKRRHLVATGARTLLESLPEARATNDLDMFLRAELLSDLSRTREVRDAILRFGYTPVEEAKFLQWKREVLVAGVAQEVKIDVLVGPLGEFRTKLKVSMPRVRPRGDIQFHAHAVEEAILVEDHPIAVEVTGVRSTGEPYQGTVEVPEAFPYLMMKLHAFADRKADANKDLGRHHALDAYTIVGMMTEPEYDRAKRIGAEQSGDMNVERARAIVREDFSVETGMGILRMREHPLFKPDFQLDQFRQVVPVIREGGTTSSSLLNEGRSGMRLLKCLCQTEEEKTVAWHSDARSLERHGIPREFTTRSGVIIIICRGRCKSLLARGAASG